MCTNSRKMHTLRRQAGISFVELIMFIIVVSVGIVGVLSVINYNTSKSADPLIQKQALAIAESLLEEIEMQPFSFCDPDDAGAEEATAPSTAGGCAVIEVLGPEGAETRTNVNAPYDNVNDYVTPDGKETEITIVDVSDGSEISALANYKAYVTITSPGIGTVPVEDSLRIDVRVTGPAGVEVKLTGYRLRYAPRSV